MAANVNASVRFEPNRFEPNRFEPNRFEPKMGRISGNRWVQLICGVIAMVLISNYQYAFTLFTPGMKLSFPGVPYARIAAIFSAFILFETWPMPVAGYFVDKLRNPQADVAGCGVHRAWMGAGRDCRQVAP